jgi:hypothetical protein
VSQPCEVYVSLMQEDVRLMGAGEYHCMGLFLFKVSDNRDRLARYDSSVELIGRPTKFINTREGGLWLLLPLWCVVMIGTGVVGGGVVFSSSTSTSTSTSSLSGSGSLAPYCGVFPLLIS